MEIKTRIRLTYIDSDTVTRILEARVFIAFFYFQKNLVYIHWISFEKYILHEKFIKYIYTFS